MERIASLAALAGRWVAAVPSAGFCRHLADGQTAQLLADRVGCGDQQSVELVDGFGACLERSKSCVAQQPQAFHPPVGTLWNSGEGARQQRPGGDFGVDGIALAAGAAALPVGPVGFQDLDAMSAQVSGQASAVAAGALDRHRAKRPQRTGPDRNAETEGPQVRRLVSV
jgi:hypothetical protein